MSGKSTAHLSKLTGTWKGCVWNSSPKLSVPAVRAARGDVIFGRNFLTAGQPPSTPYALCHYARPHTHTHTRNGYLNDFSLPVCLSRTHTHTHTLNTPAERLPNLTRALIIFISRPNHLTLAVLNVCRPHVWIISQVGRIRVCVCVCVLQIFAFIRNDT